MPTPCYISITGQTQGNITAGAFTADSVGNIYVQGHEDEMLVQEFLHNVTVPTDPAIRSTCGSARPQTVHLYRGVEQSCSADVQRTGLRRNATNHRVALVAYLC
ncbi:type VI secretion system tube protein TssD [Escherichia fergusonii]|uniref:type VI secretion system tube protein TssD n=1 Tax=Escherichia fergusonii TaxID=564 RepID=UPI002FF59781